MEAKVDHLDKLMDILSSKTKQPLTTKGYGAMSKMMGEDEIQKRYLYESIYDKKKKAKAKGKSFITLNDGRIDFIAKYLGYTSYRDFTEQMDAPVDPILASCTGNYYSYVRQNDDQGVVLRSPVKIEMKEGKVWFELKGGRWIYSGEVQLSHGCLFILMRASAGKMIHHVYKIGAREKPLVLQGIFSGVSTAFDPIGGRAVLVREKEDFNKLSNEKWEVAKMLKSGDPALKNIGQYLAAREGNNLSINSIGMTFGIDDLRDPQSENKKPSQKKLKAPKPAPTSAKRTRR